MLSVFLLLINYLNKYTFAFSSIQDKKNDVL